LFSEDKDRSEIYSIKYYKGFVNSPLKGGEEGSTNNRGDGLTQTFQLAGYSAVILVCLTAAFLKSNEVF
jgi:hypothetical protein